MQRKRVGSRQNACSGELGQGRFRECRSRLRTLNRGFWQLRAACRRCCWSKCNRGFCRSRGPLAVALRAHGCTCSMSAAFRSNRNAHMQWRCSASRVLCAQLRPKFARLRRRCLLDKHNRGSCRTHDPLAAQRLVFVLPCDVYARSRCVGAAALLGGARAVCAQLPPDSQVWRRSQLPN